MEKKETKLTELFELNSGNKEYKGLDGITVHKVDIYKTLTIDENNFSVNEEMLQQALDQSDFTAAVYEALSSVRCPKIQNPTPTI